MFPFRRKKEEEQDSPKTLKIEKIGRKKKQPPKPWGKNERLLILLLLGGTTLISAFLAGSARKWKLPGLPKLALPSINLEGTYVFENDNKPEENFDAIKNEFNSKVGSLSGVYGFYVIRLNSGLPYGIDEKRSFQAASLIKLPVMLTLFIESEKGDINLDSTYTLNEADKIPGAGSLYYKKPGTVITYRELAKLMGKESDNTAFGILRKVLGDEKIEGTIKTVGVKNTSLKENKTTPYDIGTLFKNIYEAKVISKESRDQILDFLTLTLYEDYLPKGVPEGIRVAHKYGREVHVLNDAGIVFAQEPFVLVLMSDGVVEREAETVFPELAGLIWDFESKD